jgi:hypothetical protein
MAIKHVLTEPRPSLWDAEHTGGAGDMINVVDDYGAVGDDTADDTTAIQNALNAAADGQTVYFPRGVYKITSSLTISSQIRLLGELWFDGRGTRIRQATANTNAITGSTTGSDHLVIDGLYISGGGTLAAAVHVTQSIILNRCRLQGGKYNLHIDTDGTASDAVYFSAAYDTNFLDANTAGIYLDGNVNNFHMVGGEVAGSPTGILSDGGPLSLRIKDVAIENNDNIGIDIDGTAAGQTATGVLIEGCYFEHVDGAIDIRLGNAQEIEAVNIIGNTFVKSLLSGTGWHIDADNVDGLVIMGNWFSSDDVFTSTANTNSTLWGKYTNSQSGTTTLQADTMRLNPGHTVTPEPIGTAANEASGDGPDVAWSDHKHRVNSGTPRAVSYVEKTTDSSITATAEGSADTVVTAAAVAFDGTIDAEIEFFCPSANAAVAAGATLHIILTDGGTVLGRIATITSPTAALNRNVIKASYRYTPSNASHTFDVRAYLGASGTGTLKAGSGGATTFLPMYIKVSKIEP